MAVRIKTFLIATSAVGLVAACTGDSGGGGAAFNSWTAESGAVLDEGNFGNPTMNNVMIMSGQQGFLVNLNKRFAAEVPTMVNFEFDSAVLDGAARATLRQQADWIKQFPEVRFRVYGHTDLVGTDSYNKALGMRRARAAVNYLVSQGISRSRLEAQVSFGETQPLVVTEGRERQNRRTVTEISGIVKNHPTLLNGKYAEVIFREYVASATELPPGGANQGLGAIEAGGE